MIGIMLLTATAGIGIDFGWQPVAGSGLEYIIQIEPEMLDSLRSGKSDIVSKIPSTLRRITHCRIVVGTDPLPHQGEDFPPPDPDDPGLPGPEDDEYVDDVGLTSVDEAGPEFPGFGAPDRSSPRVNNKLDRTSKDRKAAGVRTPRFERRDADDGDPEADSPSDDRPPTSGTSTARQTEKPWVALSAALLCLFASVGANFFLGWVAVGQRLRYRALLTTSRMQYPFSG